MVGTGFSLFGRAKLVSGFGYADCGHADLYPRMPGFARRRVPPKSGYCFSGLSTVGVFVSAGASVTL